MKQTSPQEKFYLKDYGPIREAEIELKNITIFVGPQGSGKSLLAQSICFMKSIPRLLSPRAYISGLTLEQNNARDNSVTGMFNNAFTFWLGTNAVQMSHRDTVLALHTPSGSYEIKYHNHPTLGSGAHTELNLNLAQKVQDVRDCKAELSTSLEEQIYMPAGRVLFSYITPQQAEMILRLTKIELPGYMDVFYQKIKEVLRRLLEETRKGINYSDRTGFHSEFETMLGGKFLFSHDDRVMLSVTDKIAETEGYHASFGFDQRKLASGQMEVWPFIAITQDILLSKYSSAVRIYVEEPEAHLHPDAQYAIIKEIARLSKRNMHFVLITHSPYIIYAINDFLLGSKVVAAGHSLPKNIPEDAILNVDDVSAYRFSRVDGKVTSIVDSETGLLKTDELDDPAAELNTAFSAMQEIFLE